MILAALLIIVALVYFIARPRPAQDPKFKELRDFIDSHELQPGDTLMLH